jgi:hypothetical protein
LCSSSFSGHEQYEGKRYAPHIHGTHRISFHDKTGILIAEGDTWKTNRKIAISKLFTQSKVSSFESRIMEEVHFAMDPLLEMASRGQQVVCHIY